MSPTGFGVNTLPAAVVAQAAGLSLKLEAYVLVQHRSPVQNSELVRS